MLLQVTLFAHPHKESYHTFRTLAKTVDLVQWENVPGFATVHPNGANWAEFQPHDPSSNLGNELSLEEQQREVPCNQVFCYSVLRHWD